MQSGHVARKREILQYSTFVYRGIWSLWKCSATPTPTTPNSPVSWCMHTTSYIPIVGSAIGQGVVISVHVLAALTDKNVTTISA